jgi:hypothetical protein
VTKQETIAYAVRGSDGSREVCLGFEEAVGRARRAQQGFPGVVFAIVELIERHEDEPKVTHYHENCRTCACRDPENRT